MILVIMLLCYSYHDYHIEFFKIIILTIVNILTSACCFQFDNSGVFLLYFSTAIEIIMAVFEYF